MTRRGRATAEVEIADFQRAVEVPEDAVLLLVCLAGTAELGAADLHLGPLDAALLSSGHDDLLRIDGVAAVVTLRQVS